MAISYVTKNCVFCRESFTRQLGKNEQFFCSVRCGVRARHEPVEAQDEAGEVNEEIGAKTFQAFALLFRAYDEDIKVKLLDGRRVVIGMPKGGPWPKWLTNAIHDTTPDVLINAYELLLEMPEDEIERLRGLVIPKTLN